MSAVSGTGERRTSVIRCSTVAVAFPSTDPDLAEILALPFPTAVTRPRPSTVATEPSSLVHVTTTPGIVWPFRSYTVAVSPAVSANAARLTVEGAIEIDAGSGGSTGSPHAAARRHTQIARIRRRLRKPMPSLLTS